MRQEEKGRLNDRERVHSCLVVRRSTASRTIQPLLFMENREMKQRDPPNLPRNSLVRRQLFPEKH